MKHERKVGAGHCTFHGDFLVIVDVCCREVGDMDRGVAVEVDCKFFAGKNSFGVSTSASAELWDTIECAIDSRCEGFGGLEGRVLVHSDEGLSF